MQELLKAFEMNFFLKLARSFLNWITHPSIFISHINRILMLKSLKDDAPFQHLFLFCLSENAFSWQRIRFEAHERLIE